ncbi:hypothetical protein [Ammoniphilus sp. YIM 78166]|nr:hypothetical protein [Ammoniphilus sp. YIM 78166]
MYRKPAIRALNLADRSDEVPQARDSCPELADRSDEVSQACGS